MADETGTNGNGTVFIEKGNERIIVQFSRKGLTVRRSKEGWTILENGMEFKTSQDAEHWIKLNVKNEGF